MKVVEVELNRLWNPGDHYQWQWTSQHKGPHVQDTDIYRGFFQTEFHHPNRRQYSEKFRSNCTNNMPRATQYLFHSGFLM